MYSSEFTGSAAGQTREASPEPPIMVGALIAKLQSSEEPLDVKAQAFGQIYSAYQERVVSYAAKRLDADRAPDVAQETFLNAWLNVGEFNYVNTESFEGWLIAIARNNIINVKRTDHSRPQLDHGPAAVADMASPIGDPVAHLEFREEMALLGGLCEIQRKALVLRAAGYSVGEVAQIEGVEITSVKMHMQRGRQELRRAKLHAEVYGDMSTTTSSSS